VVKIAKKARVYDGTAWQEIAAAQTDLTAYSTTAQVSSTYSPISTTGLVLLNTTTYNTVASVSINDVFSTTYQNYQIVVAGAYGTSTGGVVTMRLRASGADNTSANYAYVGLTMANASGTLGTTGQTSAVVGYSGYDAVSSGWNSTIINVLRPFEANWTHYLSSSQGVNSSSQDAYMTIGGNHRVATSYTGFTLLYPTTQSGTIRVYGYKN
jgi:hypothetical protein